jgi:hypothetical protein
MICDRLDRAHGPVTFICAFPRLPGQLVSGLVPRPGIFRYNQELEPRGLCMRHSISSMKSVVFIFIVSILGLPIGAVGKVAPATKPATRPAVSRPSAAQSPEAKANLAVSKAVAALKKEYADHQKDPIAEIRKESNYFVQNPDGEATVEAILNALERRLGDEPKMDGYVKWQLLSGIKGKVDTKLAGRAVAIYQRAPQPAIRPGTDENDKRQLYQMLPNRVEDSEVADQYNKEWTEKVFRARQANEPIFRFRDELFEKLPASLMTFRAGLQDAYMRVMNGYPADKFVEGMEKDIRDWAHEARPAELSDLANLLRGLAREMTGKTPRSPEYLTQVHYDSKNQKLSWEKGRANFAKEKDLTDLADYLNQRAQTAAASKK